MKYLKAGDTISGQEVVAKITVKNLDGQKVKETMFWAKDLEATIEVEKTEVRTIGKRGIQNKPTGWTGSGSMNIYYVTSLFRRMMLQYIKTGVPVYFDMTITNEDPGSSIGKQTTALKNCTLNSINIAKFDAESEVLEESVDFTFDDVDILEVFEKPTLGKA